MHVNRTEISGPGGKPVEVEHHSAAADRIAQRLDAIMQRNAVAALPAPTACPMPTIIDAEFTTVPLALENK
jgi:hypothetical protein